MQFKNRRSSASHRPLTRTPNTLLRVSFKTILLSILHPPCTCHFILTSTSQFALETILNQ